jgi:hypothetical protein
MADHVREIARIREQTNFLGYEFLSWLFLLLDRDNGQDEITQLIKKASFNAEVKLVLGNRLITCLFNHKEQKTSIISPILETSHEIFASLKNGHLVEAMALSASFAEIHVSFQLHAQDFALTQVKIKSNYDNDTLSDEEDTLSEEDLRREELFLRFAAVDDVECLIDTLYEQFLRIRLDAKLFAFSLKTMRGQVEARLNGYLRETHMPEIAKASFENVA